MPWLCSLPTIGKGWFLERRLDQKGGKWVSAAEGPIFNINDYSMLNAWYCFDSRRIEPNLVRNRGYWAIRILFNPTEIIATPASGMHWEIKAIASACIA